MFPLPLVIACLISLGIHLIAVLVPALRPVFRTYPMGIYEWGVLLALSFSIVPGMELLKLVQRKGVFQESLGPMSRRK